MPRALCRQHWQNGTRLCDAYVDPYLATPAWEQYFEPVYGVSSVPGPCGGHAVPPLVEFNCVSSWDSTRNFPIYPKTYAEAVRSRYVRAAQVAAWVRPNADMRDAVKQAWVALALGARTSREPPLMLGVHMRGTDKFLGRKVEPSEYFPVMDDYLRAHAAADRRVLIFLATDDEGFKKATVSRYGDKVVEQGGTILRAQGTSAIWNSPAGSNGANELGAQVLVDTLLLSRCDFLLCSASAVSEFAIYYNPRLINDSYDFSLPDQPRKEWMSSVTPT